MQKAAEPFDPEGLLIDQLDLDLRRRQEALREAAEAAREATRGRVAEALERLGDDGGRPERPAALPLGALATAMWAGLPACGLFLSVYAPIAEGGAAVALSAGTALAAMGGATAAQLHEARADALPARLRAAGGLALAALLAAATGLTWAAGDHPQAPMALGVGLTEMALGGAVGLLAAAHQRAWTRYRAQLPGWVRREAALDRAREELGWAETDLQVAEAAIAGFDEALRERTDLHAAATRGTEQARLDALAGAVRAEARSRGERRGTFHLVPTPYQHLRRLRGEDEATGGR